jgi:hypothetical protein
MMEDILVKLVCFIIITSILCLIGVGIFFLSKCLFAIYCFIAIYIDLLAGIYFSDKYN